MWLTKDFHVNSIQKLHQDHWSEIRGSCLMKWKTWKHVYIRFIYTNTQISYFHFSSCATRKEKCIFPSSIKLLFLKSEKELHSTDHEFSMPSSGNHATGSQMVLYLWFHYYWLLDSHVNNNHIVRYSKENTSKVKLFSFG